MDYKTKPQNSTSLKVSIRCLCSYCPKNTFIYFLKLKTLDHPRCYHPFIHMVFFVCHQQFQSQRFVVLIFKYTKQFHLIYVQCVDMNLMSQLYQIQILNQDFSIFELMHEFWTILDANMMYTRSQNYTNRVVDKLGIQSFEVVVVVIQRS